MFQIWIEDENQEAILIHDSTPFGNHVLDAKVKKSINAIDTLTFTMLQNNTGYRKMNPMLTKATVIDRRRHDGALNPGRIFRGRLMSVTPMMDTNGLFKMNCVFEGELAYLLDSPTYPNVYWDDIIENRIETCVRNHNATMSVAQHPFEKTFNFRLAVYEPKLEPEFRKGVVSSGSDCIYWDSINYTTYVAEVKRGHVFGHKDSGDLSRMAFYTQYPEDGVASTGLFSDTTDPHDIRLTVPKDGWVAWTVNNDYENPGQAPDFVEMHQIIPNNEKRITKLESDFGTNYDLMRKIVEEFGGEYHTDYSREEPTLIYGDVISYRSSLVLRIAHNIQSIQQEKTIDEIFTRIIPVGGTSDNRLYIGDVDWIGDETLERRFGIIYRTKVFDDVTDVNKLRELGIAALEEVKKVKIKYQIKALDLSIIGIEPELHDYMLDLGHEYKVQVPQLGIDDFLRVIEMEVDISHPENTSITIGDRFTDMRHYSNFGVKAYNETKILNSKINSLK